MAVIEEVLENEDEIVLQKVETKKKEGNEHFGKGEWEKAKVCYQEALDICPPEESANTLRSLVLSNLSAALIKLEQWEAAVTVATEAIEKGCPNEKPLERRAFAYSQMDSKIDSAMEDYVELQKRNPSRTDYSRKIQELKVRIDARNEEMKKEMMDKLKGLGDFCLRPFGLSTDSFQLTPNESGGYSINMKQQTTNPEPEPTKDQTTNPPESKEDESES